MRGASFFSSKVRPFAFSCACLLAALGTSGYAHAGFLEDLFGEDDSSQQVARPRAQPSRRTGGSDFSIRVNDGRRARRAPRIPGTKDGTDADGDRREHVAGSRPQKPRLCTVSQTDPAPDAQTNYLRDETLRAGDSVVTPGDIIVFKGHGACPHTAADFVPLARSNLPKARRNALADLERAMKSPARPFGALPENKDGSKVVGQVSQ